LFAEELKCRRISSPPIVCHGWGVFSTQRLACPSAGAYSASTSGVACAIAFRIKSAMPAAGRPGADRTRTVAVVALTSTRLIPGCSMSARCRKNAARRSCLKTGTLNLALPDIWWINSTVAVTSSIRLLSPVISMLSSSRKKRHLCFTAYFLSALKTVGIFFKSNFLTGPDF
jgi:hypothetical protein